MSRIKVSVGGGAPLLDIGSHARGGPRHRDRLSPAEIQQIARTVRGAPEVMVKVTPGGSTKLASIATHVDYITRSGKHPLETDEGERVGASEGGEDLIGLWNLDVEEHRRHANLLASRGRMPSKLVYKLVLSMPAGTSPTGLSIAAFRFLREALGSAHRYAFVLHTDKPHPHVHVIIKAAGERGGRLDIDKRTLRRWRAEFATQLRAVGIEANATERAVRGRSRSSVRGVIHRAARRGESTHVRQRVQAVVQELSRGEIGAEPGNQRLLLTRRRVEEGWRAVECKLIDEGRIELARDVHRFVERMPPARTDEEWLAHDVLTRAQQMRTRELALTR